MSYDVTLYPAAAGKTPDEIEEFLETYEAPRGPTSPQALAKLRETAGALRNLNPKFDVFGAFEKPGNSIELSVDPKNGFAISVSLFNGEAAVSCPYWYQEADAKRVFEQMWSYVEVICAKLSLVAYDGQTGQIWRSRQDALAGLSVYAEEVTGLHGPDL